MVGTADSSARWTSTHRTVEYQEKELLELFLRLAILQMDADFTRTVEAHQAAAKESIKRSLEILDSLRDRGSRRDQGLLRTIDVERLYDRS